VYLCRTVEEFERHARQDHCVAVHAPEGPESSDDSSTTVDPLDPLDPDALTRLPPRPPWEVSIPTAGVPRKTETNDPTPEMSNSKAGQE
jgi:hypothetical protein